MNKYNKHFFEYFIKSPTNEFKPQPIIQEPKKQIYRQIEPVCFDIMEMIGKEYTFIKDKQKTKQKMSGVLSKITETLEECDDYDEVDFHFKSIKINSWAVYFEDWWEWDDQQIIVGNHYEKYPNPYIELKPLLVGSMADEHYISVPNFMILGKI